MATQKIEGPLTPDVEIIFKGHKVPYYLDKEVFEFALAMQNTLDGHRPTKGDSWKDMTSSEVLTRMEEELEECQLELIKLKHKKKDHVKLQKELTDVALFAMFGFINLKDFLPI